MYAIRSYYGLNHIGTPEETVETANLLYRAFEPKPLIFRVNLISSVGKGDALAMGLDNNANISDLMKSMFNVSSNTVSSFLTAPNAVIIGSVITSYSIHYTKLYDFRFIS